MKFTKMHALGNDYLYVFGSVPDNVVSLCKKLCDRHFGVGSDGIIYISHSSVADFRMRIFNADGSESEMCGNGIRCVGKYLYDKGLTDKMFLTIETLAGIRELELHIDGHNVKTVTVNMGEVTVGKESTLAVDGKTVEYTPVSVGNPHAVIFVSDAEHAPLEELGPKIEKHENFPEGVNVEFIEVLSNHTIRMRVWERGSGVTMACGTGACASAAAAAKRGLCNFDKPIYVLLDGGELQINVSHDLSVTMTGPAVAVCEGETVLC